MSIYLFAAFVAFVGADDSGTCTSVSMLQKTTEQSLEKVHEEKQAMYPSEIFICNKRLGNMVSGSDHGRYRWIVKKIVQKYERSDDQEKFAGCLVRFAGHDFMDFRWWSSTSASGGSDGCIDFSENDNAGLSDCLKATGIAHVYSIFCNRVELADFLVIAAEAVMAVTSDHWSGFSKKDSLEQRFMTRFTFGRKTAFTCPDNAGLMPDPEEGCYDLKRVFVDHIFLHRDPSESWKATTAISGAHTLGGAKLSNSGYDGFWTEDPGKFNGEYFKRILDRGWGPELNVGQNSNRNQWKLVDNSRPKRKQMMLNSDLCLIYDNGIDSVRCDQDLLAGRSFSKASPDERLHRFVFCEKIRGRGRFLNAKERPCCAWVRPDKMWANPKDHWHKGSKKDWKPLAALYNQNNPKNNHCGAEFKSPSSSEFKKEGNFRSTCCRGVEDGEKGDMLDCDYRGNLEAPGWEWVNKFAVNESAWLDAYIDAWEIATGNSLLFTTDTSNTKKAFSERTRDECGCCRIKDIVDGDEGFEECEKLAQENTRSKAFWKTKAKTWPYSPLNGEYDKSRESVKEKFNNYYALSNKWGAKWGSWFKRGR
jgi:hypothetical protein